MNFAVALSAAALTLLAPARHIAAPAVERDNDRSGPVRATATWQGSYLTARRFRLAISRDGTDAYERRVRTASCARGPAGCPLPASEEPVHVDDLDGDHEPEVILDVYLGGAHCCFVAMVHRWDGSRYVRSERYFGNPDYRVDDLNGDGRFEFESADDRFSYLYTEYAGSVWPIRIIGFDHGDFSDVTSAFVTTVQEDARELRREYRRRTRVRRERVGVRAALAAYVADLYRLDRDHKADRTLESALDRGLLERRRRQVGPFGRKFIRDLKQRLRRWGYR